MTITLRHHFKVSPIDQVHFWLEVLILELRQCLYLLVTRFGLRQQYLVFKCLEEMNLSSGRYLIREILWHYPVNGDIGKGALSPACRNIEVVDKTSYGFFDLFIGELILKYIGCEIGVKRGKCLCSRPLTLQYPEEICHLPQCLPEMPRRATLYPASDTIETLIQQYPQTPACTVARKTIQIMDMVISITVSTALFLIIYTV